MAKNLLIFVLWHLYCVEFLVVCFLHRPQFIAAYFNEPDKEGHAGGPNSDLVCVIINSIHLVWRGVLYEVKLWPERGVGVV